jgi:hypothetical protein
VQYFIIIIIVIYLLPPSVKLGGSSAALGWFLTNYVGLLLIKFGQLASPVLRDD